MIPLGILGAISRNKKLILGHAYSSIMFLIIITTILKLLDMIMAKNLICLPFMMIMASCIKPIVWKLHNKILKLKGSIDTF